MSYQVKLDVFEGPFDLLVWLVEKSGMDVCTVNISEITDQYIAYVRSGRSIPPDAAAEFMVLAATLLQIKSRMLLPAGEDPGQSAEEDLREELAEKISTYRRYRGLAEYLREKEEDAEHIFVKPGEDLSRYTEHPEEILDVSMDRFIESFRSFLERKKKITDVRRRYEYVERRRMSMEEKEAEILRKLSDAKKVFFPDLLPGGGDLYDIVLTFVTLLELLSQERVCARQHDIFGEIEISRKEAGVLE